MSAAVDAPSDSPAGGAPADAASAEGAAAVSPIAAAAAETTTLPREDRSASHQREDRFDTAAKHTEDALQGGQRRRHSGAGMSASRTGDDSQEVGEGPSCRLNDVALDGVVFMVYAKRLQ